MKVNSLAAVASATLLQYAAAKEIKTNEIVELYESGTRHHEIMSIKHVRVDFFNSVAAITAFEARSLTGVGQMGRGDCQWKDGLFSVQEPSRQGTRHLH